MIVYLGHPIDLAGDKAQYFAVQAQVARNVLTSVGCCVYSPADAWQVATPMSPKIQQINLEALLASDAAMFIMPMSASSLGVPFELAYAHIYNIPTVIVRGLSTVTEKMRGESALLSFLENATIFGDSDIQLAALFAASVAKNISAANAPTNPENATESNGDPTERTGK
jgi:hypothetical protein